MSFTEEQNKALDDKLSALSDKMLGHLTETMNKSLSGMAKRLLVDEVPKAIQSQFAPIEEKLNSLNFNENQHRQLLRSEMDSWLEELNKQAANENTGGDNSAAGNTNTPTDIPALNELRNQLAEQAKIADAMKQRVEAAEKVAADERKVRETLAEQQRLAGMDDKVLSSLRGKVRNNTERQLLALLKNDGLLIEDKENSQFLVKSKDEYGLDINVPVEAALGDLVKQHYPHFEEVRPGTGTGAMPGSSTSTSSMSGKWFGSNRAPDASAMLDPNNLKEMLAELDSQIKR
jgi:hypothetical protein